VVLSSVGQSVTGPRFPAGCKGSQRDRAQRGLVTAYDAARKALTAILATQGLRAKGGDGGHTVLLDVVRPQFPDHRAVLLRFDWLRNVRNKHPVPRL
jgi:hypothetical protein